MKQTKSRSGQAVKAAGRSSPRRLRSPSSKARTGPKIPAILFEGDTPAISPVRGASQKYATGAGPTAECVDVHEEELPEAYGTQKLLLLARDPHWLYSHWDLTREQQQRYNARSTHNHLVLRVHRNGDAGTAAEEIHLHPESRSWFIHVDRAETRYVAELGYYRSDQKWIAIAISSPAVTPPDTESEDKTVQFATMPVPKGETRVPASSLAAPTYALVQGDFFSEMRQTLPTLAQSRFSFESGAMFEEWTEARERALAEEIGLSHFERRQAGSMEIWALIAKQGQQENPSSIDLNAISSPLGGMEQGKEFWLEVNAELLIYGGTKPDASLTFDGRPLTLRPDGTFSCRVALPDGHYDVVIEAISAENDSRRARLKFSRCTEWG
jgi:hypothetical protein